MSALGFRPLAEDDLALLFNWLARPHVKRWYAPAPSSFAEIAAKYRPRTTGDNEVKAFVVQSDGVDVGYIQAYAIESFADYAQLTGCEKGVVGVDLFIADEWRTRHGMGTQVIRRFVDDIVFGSYGATACVAGPAEGNKASMRAFEKAGFREWKSIVNEKGERECLMRLDRDTVGFRIETIDLVDAPTSASFQRDMYEIAFGTIDGLDAYMGAEDSRYLAQLRERLAQIPEGNVHAWHGEEIVGQLEMKLIESEPHVAYVSLIYVKPGHREHGLGRLLHERAAEVARRRGMRILRLSVALTNVPAIMFYRRLGWEMVGTRPNVQPMAVMEFSLALHELGLGVLDNP